MPSIRILPDRVANQIAAGEVVERPAAVVKELVENSLDAGAKKIVVEFRHGGRAYISVSDNGSGMDREDALLCLERHATSKISNAGDLDALQTFGFRGEALPSIASVSQFVLQSRKETTTEGTEVAVNGGRIVHVRECGLPQGTRVTVSSLFNSVPARRKFLKTDTTEAAHIIQAVRFAALANPRVAFTLIEDDRVIFQSPSSDSLLDRVREIFGRQITEGLLAVSATSEGMRLTGLVGNPSVSRATRQEMITFVNRRPVDSRPLAYAILESYQLALPKGRFPLAFLFLEIDPAQVDVNVHPTKREVRFRNETSVRTFVVRTLLETLREASKSTLPPASAVPATPAAPVPIVVQRSPAEPTPKQPFSPPVTVEASPSRPAPIVLTSPIENRAASPAITPVVKGSTSDWSFRGEILGQYFLFETMRGLALIETQAAEERIIFEEVEAAFCSGKMQSQKLLFPVSIELDPISSALLLDQRSLLESYGLEVAEFGRNFFRIEAIPHWLEPSDAETLLRDTLAKIREGKIDSKKPDLARVEFSRLAATKAAQGRKRRDPAMLATRLLACKQPLLTPSGRPTIIELTHGELARRFCK